MLNIKCKLEGNALSLKKNVISIFFLNLFAFKSSGARHKLVKQGIKMNFKNKNKILRSNYRFKYLLLRRDKFTCKN